MSGSEIALYAVHPTRPGILTLGLVFLVLSIVPTVYFWGSLRSDYASRSAAMTAIVLHIAASFCFLFASVKVAAG